ncbi:MAG: nucleotidyltransferase family protein [Candidatus Methylomirabilales bacterium]
MFSDLSVLCVHPTASIRQAIACLDRTDCKIALVVDEENRLLDTITDGDVRRAILAGLDLDTPVNALQGRRAGSPYYPQPVTAPVGMESSDLLRLMQECSVRQVPLLDGQQHVVGLVTLRDLLPSEVLPLQAVVMVGGYGNRLRPLTEELPKAMLPVAERPLLELILQQLREVGIRHVNLATHYKRDLITRHFGDGRDFGMEIRYVEEDQPLGTAGALSKLETSDDPLLVINGDILTRVDFHAMLDFHRQHRADMTVAVRQQEFQIPYGVIETNGVQISAIVEKPIRRDFINAGIYLLNAEVCAYVPSGQPYEMPDLITRLVADGRQVIAFPVREYWLDIGRPEDYTRARDDITGEGFAS